MSAHLPTGEIVRNGVSVVIPHYGSPLLAQRLIRQIHEQATDCLLQIIVSDDASPEPFLPQDGVEVVRRQKNGGFGTAVNSGVAMAKYPFLLILNSDLEIQSDLINRFLEVATNVPCAVLGPQIIDGSSGHSIAVRRFPTNVQAAVASLAPLERWQTKQWCQRALGVDVRCRPGEITRVDWLIGAVLFMPTERFRAIGGFDERFFMNSEEIDLQRRLTDGGVVSIYVGSASVVHHAGGSTPRDHQVAWLMEGKQIYLKKWGGLWSYRLLLSSTMVVNIVWNAMRVLWGRPAQPWAPTKAYLRRIWGFFDANEGDLCRDSSL